MYKRQLLLLLLPRSITRYIIWIKTTSAVRWRISSKLIFASCVGYFDRAYYGFYVTSSRMLVLIKGNKI